MIQRDHDIDLTGHLNRQEMADGLVDPKYAPTICKYRKILKDPNGRRGDETNVHWDTLAQYMHDLDPMQVDLITEDDFVTATLWNVDLRL